MARPVEPGRAFCSRQILQEQGKKSFVDNVSDKTHTAMHFHTFIRPDLADQTVVPAVVPRVIPSHVNSFFIVDKPIMMQLFLQDKET